MAILDELSKLNPVVILPDHSPPGDQKLIQEQHDFLVEIRQRALQLKKQSKTAKEASLQLTTELKEKYPAWDLDHPLDNFVKSVFDE